jgi:uncharacterized protein (DUF4415 family)
MKDKTDWKRVNALTDADIDQAVAGDPDTFLPDDEWFKNAKWVRPEKKKMVTLRIDPSIIDWFRKRGAGYQSRINAVLKAYVEAHTGKDRRR